MRVRLHQYGPSKAARRLARKLGILRLRNPTKFIPREGDVIINWGDSNLRPTKARIINNPRAVRNAVRKLDAFKLFRDAGVPHPEFTTSKEVAHEWQKHGPVVARVLARAGGGRGLYVCDTDVPLPNAPLYTRYVKKRDEYRVFVVGGQVARVTQKRKRRDNDVDYRVRNGAGGWVFCQEDVDVPDAVTSASLLAVSALGLDFGAVDVGWNAHYEKACVYEVNTAFGMEGTTLTVVADALRELIYG